MRTEVSLRSRLAVLAPPLNYDAYPVTTCTSHFTIGGQSRTIEVLEIDMALLKYNAEGVIWPEGLPQCEGAMLWYA